MLPLSLIVAGSLLSSVFCAIGPSSDLHIVNKRISPDGFTRSTVLAGSDPSQAMFPGPVITGFKGSRFLLNVIDSLTDDTMDRVTTVHWHGLYQQGSIWEDGVEGVSQCPIVPGHSYLYDFKVHKQAGTYWYHSHLSAQYCDGLRGAFVVYDRLDPHRWLYDIDDESTIITLADWYHAPSLTGTIKSLPDSILINGNGRYLGGPATPFSIVNVIQNKRYRFRLVAMSCASNFVFGIDGHDMTIIEADGVSLQPITVDELQIFAGQRYSFILAADQPVDNYWIRANPNKGPPGFDGGLNSAILRYSGAPSVDPITPSTIRSSPLIETNLHPLENIGALDRALRKDADIAINLELSINTENETFNINRSRFFTPSMPVLLQIMSGKQSAQDLLPSGSVYTLPHNKVIEISIPGGLNGSPHPFHLHGHTFDVVRSAGSQEYNYHNPVRRDVVSTGFAGDNVTIRFVTDNSGPWILHCHIDWHLRAGMAVVFAEDTRSISSMVPPESWDQLCPIYNAFNTPLAG
ncbi:laccase 2 precursor [Collybia nuda]|uniref:laccase n=1 Tax=Collybia nuda TaxID=64659 RepID=A0A9P5Y4J3_9AGAR|nr:laccase 2 precursor [Collybia nuda]